MEQTQKLKQAVKEYKEGKAEAFTPLYEESKKYIYTVIYSIMKGNNNALDATEEIMNDTYFEISQKISQLREDEKFLSWAKTIAISKSFYYIKKNQKYVLLSEDDDMLDNITDSDDIIPEEVMMSNEKQRLVREILNTQLTYIQKVCVTSVYYHDMKQSEIAEELGIPENTVKTHLYRAKAKIKVGVEDLAKNKNTKLYSVAPLMLLLFQEEVKAAVVPQHISVGVLSAITGTAGTATAGAATVGATSAGIKGLFAKIASASLKAKLIGTVATVATVATIGGATYVASQEEKSEENTYKDSLISSEEDGANENDLVHSEIEQEEQEVEPSEEEMECLKILAKYFTATRTWGEDLSGKEMVPNEENVCEFIWYVANDNYYFDNWPYDKYLPERAESENSHEIYSLQSIQAYVKSVFNIDILGIPEIMAGSFLEQDGNYIAGDAQFSSGDKCEITSVVAKGDAYTVQGTCVFGSYEEDFYSEEPIYRDSYDFTMTLTKNADSPLGFTFEKISYEKAEVVLEDSQYEMFLEMEKAAEVAYIYNWTMDQNFTIDPDEMSALMKMNYMAQGYRFGWGNYTGEEISIEELSKAMESVTGTQVLRAEVDAQVHENQTENYNYKGTDYAEGMVKLYVRLEAFYGAGFIDRYEIDKNQFTYYNKTLSFTSGDEVETYIDRVIKIGDEVIVYGANNRFDVPFVMHLEEDEASLTGYKLDYIYYFVSQSQYSQM